MGFTWQITLTIAALAALGYGLGIGMAHYWRRAGKKLHSLPSYHGYYFAFWGTLPVIAAMLLNLIGWSDDHNAVVLAWLGGAACIGYAWFYSGPQFPARLRVERYAQWILKGCALISILITATIVLSVLFESIRFFKIIPIGNFLFGLHWSPQQADSATQAHAFGAVPLFTGTLLIMLVAMAVAIPIGLFSAIYMAEYATRRTRSIAKPMLEILAGIPTVVYGYFAISFLSPLLRQGGLHLGLDIASESALVAGLVMGIMIIPFMSSLSDDIITAVPKSLREAAYGMGATPSETIKGVVLPAALPGIMGAALLAVSRAIGETMIVVMAAGLAANMTLNPLESVTTVTAQIVSLLTGDQEFDSAKTLAAFALGLALFVVTLMLNIVALVIVRAYREKYE